MYIWFGIWYLARYCHSQDQHIIGTSIALRRMVVLAPCLFILYLYLYIFFSIYRITGIWYYLSLYFKTHLLRSVPAAVAVKIALD